MEDDIINKIAKLIKEDQDLSMFHGDDDFKNPPTYSQVMSQLFLHGWDFRRPAEDALRSLEELAARYGLNQELESQIAHDIIQNYNAWQAKGYWGPDLDDAPAGGP